jgi:hypothetical protein
MVPLRNHNRAAKVKCGELSARDDSSFLAFGRRNLFDIGTGFFGRSTAEIPQLNARSKLDQVANLDEVIVRAAALGLRWQEALH